MPLSLRVREQRIAGSPLTHLVCSLLSPLSSCSSRPIRKLTSLRTSSCIILEASSWDLRVQCTPVPLLYYHFKESLTKEILLGSEYFQRQDGYYFTSSMSDIYCYKNRLLLIRIMFLDYFNKLVIVVWCG